MTDENIEIGETTIVEPRRYAVHSWWLASAAVLFLALWGWRELGIRAMRETIESQKAEIRQLTLENDRLAQRSDKIMAAMASSEARTVSLAGQQAAPAASGKMFLDTKGGRAILVVSSLPPSGVSRSYQLWITRPSDPKPQSVGIFDVSSSGNATLSIENVPTPAEISSVGVSLEVKGGATAPTAGYSLVGKL